MKSGDSKNEILRPLGLPDCRVLLSHKEIDAAEMRAQRLGLVPNPQRLKAWDNVLAVGLIAQFSLSLHAAIVDLGCRSGILLTWLDQLGYRNLHGCDLQKPFPPVRSALKQGLWPTVAAGTRTYLRHRRRLHTAPLEHTGLASGGFSVVASMSVIEHGVDVARFFDEAGRLLKPGGSLIVSTDYWPRSIDLGSFRRFAMSHGPDRIFDREGIDNLCEIAGSSGFDVPQNRALEADEPVVESSGFRYTFLVLSFRRQT